VPSRVGDGTLRGIIELSPTEPCSPLSDFDDLWVEGDREHYDGDQTGGCILNLVFLLLLLILALCT